MSSGKWRPFCLCFNVLMGDDGNEEDDDEDDNGCGIDFRPALYPVWLVNEWVIHALDTGIWEEEYNRFLYVEEFVL